MTDLMNTVGVGTLERLIQEFGSAACDLENEYGCGTRTSIADAEARLDEAIAALAQIGLNVKRP